MKIKHIFISLCLLSVLTHYNVSRAAARRYQHVGVAAAAAVSAAAVWAHAKFQHNQQITYQQQPKKIFTERTLPANAPTTTIFAHGLWGTRVSGTHYQKRGFIPGHLTIFDFPDSKLGQRKPAALAQEIDIQCLAQQYKKAVAQGKKVILRGVSRGGSTIAAFLGMYDTKNVVAVIIESPFDDVKNVVRNVLHKCYLHRIPGLATAATFGCSLLHSRYNPYGIRPIDVVHKIQKSIPIFIVTTQEDELIPVSSTRALYTALKQAGHNKVHLLVTQRGRHAHIISGPDSTQFLNDSHAFLRKYGLQHNPAYARLSSHPDFVQRKPLMVLRPVKVYHPRVVQRPAQPRFTKPVPVARYKPVPQKAAVVKVKVPFRPQHPTFQSTSAKRFVPRIAV